ncbi:MAG TPA: PA14 domain-containing protein [Candidatus Paceibacterota bacterium]|nr:PA14 domain-containing protein [Verrucomicrobiota bacterium]HRY50976.1 PA14 domain-containing protein [Candidatus Paceibacterota bacterium]
MKALTLVLLLVGLNARVQAGYILRVFYDGIPGSAVSDLTSAPSFPNGPNPDGSPLQTEMLTDLFEGLPISGNGADNYGSWIRGFLEVPATDDYTFYIASDDDSQLWLSTDSNPANKKLISSVTGWTGAREWTKYASQKSAPVKLTAGQKYYVEVLQKEGGGGDNIAVGWQRPGTGIAPIPALYLQGYPMAEFPDPSFLTQPRSMTVPENSFVTIFANLNASHPVNYQWLRNGLPVPGAVMSSYTFKVTLADNGTVFYLIAGNGRGLLVSDPATITVVPDTTPATIASVESSMFNPYEIKVSFSEPIQVPTAANFALDKGATVTEAKMGANDTTVVLKTSELMIGGSYTLTAVGVLDKATVPNGSNSSKEFSIASQVKFNVIDGTSGTGTNDFLNNAKYKAKSFDRSVWVNGLAVPWNFGEYYIGQLEAYLIPPTTGDYTFWVYADDGCLLYLSSDDSPANKKVIAGFNGWTDERQYDKYNDVAGGAYQKSAPITLEAGRRYYLEAVVIEGSGGDGIGVAWRKPGEPAEVTNGDQSVVISGAALAYYGPTGPITITEQPVNVTVNENETATFSVKVTGMPSYNYQWYQDGVAIAGATGASYSVKATAARATDKYWVVVNNQFSEATSDIVNINVVLDLDSPTVVGAGSLTTNVVHVVFNEGVDSATATTKANYVLKRGDGAAVNVNSAELLNPSTVLLKTADLVSDTEYELAISNVKDAAQAGNVMTNVTVMFKPINLWQTVRINNTQAYSAVALGDRIETIAGGADIWGNSDQFVFTYKQVTGNFDYVVKLESLDNSDPWAKAGLMARATLDAGSRHVINAGTPGAGNNLLTMQYRDTTGGASSDSPTVQIKPPSFQYPNAWLRMQRIGSVFYCYYSPNGVDWIQHNKKDSATSTEGAMPDTLYVGLAVCSHSTTKTTKAIMTGFAVPPSVPFELKAQPQSQTALQGNKATFSVSIAGNPPYFYQWQRNGQNISGATSGSYTTPALKYNLDDGAIYRCIISNLLGSVLTSDEAKLTVPSDTNAPTVVSATGSMFFNKATVVFSEPVDPASGGNLANYAVDGGLTLEAAQVNGASVMLTTSAQTPGKKYNLTINNVTDLVGYKIPANSKVSFSGWVLVPNLAVLDVFDNISGTAVADLTKTDKYKNNTPDRSFAYNKAESASGIADNYGARLATIVTPPETGDYFFYVYSDDASELYISTDENPANKGTTPIAKVNTWTNVKQWTKEPNQKSAAVSLEAGKQYYIEALVKEGGGGDHVGIAWVAPSQQISPSYSAQGENSGSGETAPKAFDKSTSTKWLDFANVAAGTVDVKINFQNTNSAGYAGYLPDNGFVFADQGNGYSYGWNQDNSANARDRNNTASQDERYDTFNHMEKPGGPWIWEIELPNDLYQIHIVGGDPSNFDSTIKLMAEDVLIVNGDPCTTDQRFREGTGLVDLKDGKLTISVAPGAANAKIAFLEIKNGISKRASWIQYLYAGTGTKAVTQYNVVSANDAPERDPMDWKFYGVNEDGSMDLLDTQTGQSFAARYSRNTYPIANTQEYRGYRLVIDSVKNPATANSVQLSEIELIDATGANTTEKVFGDGDAAIGSQYIAFYVNPDKSFINITQHPTSATVVENRTVTFSVTATGGSQYSSAPSYQWQRDGVDIPGATGASYTTPLLTTADSGAKFRCVLSVPALTVNSEEATLTVNADNAPPVVSGAAGLVGSWQINVFFDELVDPDTATDIANYGVLGGLVSDAEMARDGKTVLLTVEWLAGDSAQVWVNNIQDLKGNTMTTAAYITAPLSQLTARDVGTQDSTTFLFTDPLEKGQTIALTTKDFNVIAGGSDIWNKADGFHFAYERKTGDFDMAVQVARLDIANNWSKAGIMAREKITAGSRNVNLVVDPKGTVQAPDGSGTGANRYEANNRPTEGGDSSAWPNLANNLDVPYPNAWLRLQRVGNTFVAYRGSNGVDWIEIARMTAEYPADMYVGLALTAHNNAAGQTTYAEFRNYGPVPRTPLAIGTQPLDAYTLQGKTATFTATPTGSQPYTFQWMRNGTAISGATKATYTTPTLTYAADNGAKYSCVISNLYGEVLTTREAVLSIDPDFVKPTVVSVTGSTAMNEIKVTFSEPVNEAAATALSNYVATGGITLQSATLSSSKSVVSIKTTAQTQGAAYSLKISNVPDVAGNLVDTVTKNFSGWVFAKGYLVSEFYGNIGGGTTIPDLTNSQIFKDGKPTSVSAVTGVFETPSNVADNYGLRVYGLLIPPISGAYTFWIATDDAGQLFLSSNDNPANKGTTPIAAVSGWAGIREYNKEAGQKSAPINLEAGKMYYVEALMKEGGGGDNLAVAATAPGQPATINNGDAPISSEYFGVYYNPDNSSVQITQQPVDATVQQGRKATFTVVATGKSDISTTVGYQWQKNGADIAGATAATLTIAAADLADNGAKFRCIVNVPSKSATSAEATLTVTPDTVPPVPQSAAGMIGSGEVHLYFDEVIDPVTGSTADNYGVSGAVVKDAMVATDGKSVVLSVAGLTGTTVNVAVNKVQDLAGNAMPAVKILAAPLSKLAAQDVGTQDPNTLQFTNPLEPGATWARSATDFDVVAGGTDIWDNSDGFHFVYEQRSGDFDVVVQVARLDIANNWTKGGLMMREELTGDSRNLNLVVDPKSATPAPDGSGSGANVYEANHRPTKGGASSAWPGLANNSDVPYPNAWMRLKRAGNVFTAYRGNDGLAWQQIATITIEFPQTVYLGLATTAHNNNPGNTTYAEYRNFKNFSP